MKKLLALIPFVLWAHVSFAVTWMCDEQKPVGDLITWRFNSDTKVLEVGQVINGQFSPWRLGKIDKIVPFTSCEITLDGYSTMLWSCQNTSLSTSICKGIDLGDGAAAPITFVNCRFG